MNAEYRGMKSFNLKPRQMPQPHWAAEQLLWAAEILLLQLKEKKRGLKYLDANVTQI